MSTDTPESPSDADDRSTAGGDRGPAGPPARPPNTLRIGHLAGVPIGVHPLWLVIVALITYSLGRVYFPDHDHGLSDPAAYALGLVSALGLFGGILLHELGHAVVARRHGMVIDEIDLWLLGGVSRMHGEPKEPRDELAFAAAGPAVTAVLLVAFSAVLVAVGTGGPDWLRALVEYQVYISAAILVFNLLPAFPLDGGRVLRSLLWWKLQDRDRATTIAAAGGRGFGIVLLGLGFLALLSGAVGGLWLALIGGFLMVASAAEAQGTHAAHALGTRTVTDVMSAPPVSLPANASVAEAVSTGFTSHLFTAFPVVDEEGRALGMLSANAVRHLPPAARATTRVEAVATLDPTLLVAAGTPAVSLLSLPAFGRFGRVTVVGTDGRPLGVVSTTDLERRIRAEGLRASGSRR